MHFFFAKNPIQISRRAKRGGQFALAKSFLAEEVGLEPTSPCGRWFSKPVRYQFRALLPSPPEGGRMDKREAPAPLTNWLRKPYHFFAIQPQSYYYYVAFWFS